MSKLRLVLLAIVGGKTVPVFTIERAITAERMSGNFSTGLISIGGERYRIGLDSDKQIYPGFPTAGVYRSFQMVAYKSYVQACNKENLDAHSLIQWANHGYPLDAIGSRLDWSYERAA